MAEMDNMIEKVTSNVSKSIDGVLKQYKEGNIETEPSLTDRLLANIERDFSDASQIEDGNINITTRTFKDRGAGAAEKSYGADLMTVLNIDIENYKISKGFLAQAKLIKKAKHDPKINYNAIKCSPYQENINYNKNPYGLTHKEIAFEKSGTIAFKFTKNEFKILKEQCEKMLKITSDSFVYLYCPDDIYIIPATAVCAKDENTEFYCKNHKAFFTDYLKSFIGDIQLDGTKNDNIEELMEKNQIRRSLKLDIRQNESQV